MKRTILACRLATIAVCALALAAVASVKNPVTRPHQSQGVLTLTVYLADFSWDFHGMGEGTHLGRMTTYTSSALIDDQGRMRGIATAANGDQLFWVIPGTSGWYLEFTGGTGRFQNASGGQNTVYESEHVTIYDPQLNALVTTWSQKAEGLITY